MNSVKWKVYVFFILLSEAVGIVAGILTREGMQIYSETVTKPALTPPAIVFPIVWTILYALMGAGVAGVTLKPQSNERTRGLILYALQFYLILAGVLYSSIGRIMDLHFSGC